MFKKPIKIIWKWQLNALPEEIWPYLSDTNRLFKDINQPGIQQADITKPLEPEFAQLTYNNINRYNIWEEEPYEWEYPFRFGVVRYYKSGSYKNLKIQVDLQPNKQGTILQLTLWAKPRMGVMSVLSTLKLKTIVKRRIRQTIRSYDLLALQNKKHFQLAQKNQLKRNQQRRLEQVLDQLGSTEVNLQILDQLVGLVQTGDDLELQRIQPYEFADCCELPRQEVLKVFINAAKAGLLSFRWDLYCPKCRSIQHSVKTLNQIHEPIHCHDCDQQFNVNFNRTIQLSFTPHPLIRKVNKKEYCNRGPQSSPHIFIQQYLKPGEQCFVKTNLPKGQYLLRTKGNEGVATVTVNELGNETVHITLSEKGFDGEHVSIGADPNLSFTNATQSPQLLILEQKEWAQKGLSAAEATSCQLFRNLFADEVLRKGEKISVDNLTLMFTDLFDSTGIYTENGDEKAVGQLINHFEILQEVVAQHQGAIVKTIGDSVMAVFCKPEQAFKAYLTAQQTLSGDDRFSNHLQLNAGIHHGSCMAVNLNSRIDYFGSTVNIASRFVDLAEENEVVVSQNTFSSAQLQAMLTDVDTNSTIKNANTRLKGFNSEYFTIKSIKLENTALRLVI